MAYLHCHTEGCEWSQDDFWELFYINKWEKRWWKKIRLGYNPISKMWDDIKWLWKPKWMKLDKWIIDDITKYTGVNVKVREVQTENVDWIHALNHGHDPQQPRYYTEYQVFSWSWLWVEFVKEWKNFRKMKWWTTKSWEKAKDTAVCPKCGKRNFDID